MTATEAEDLAKAEGLVLVPSNSGPHHPRYLGVSMHTDPATNEVFFCASVIQQGTTLYLQDALGNVKFTSDAEAALTFARYTAGRNTVDERSQAPVMPFWNSCPEPCLSAELPDRPPPLPPPCGARPLPPPSRASPVSILLASWTGGGRRAGAGAGAGRRARAGAAGAAAGGGASGGGAAAGGGG